jgi:hypothetical protein
MYAESKQKMREGIEGKRSKKKQRNKNIGHR